MVYHGLEGAASVVFRQAWFRLACLCVGKSESGRAGSVDVDAAAKGMEEGRFSTAVVGAP